MRTALISDIHGHYDGLQAVLADIAQQQCDRIVCLGDLVDGGTQSVEVVRAIRELGIAVVCGNHDEDGVRDKTLPEDVRDFLKSLPENIAEDEILYTHISPAENKRKIHNPIEAWNIFDGTKWRRIFVGHAHIPLIFGERCDEIVSATEYPIRYEKEFALDPNDRYIVCLSAVGYSRDGDRRLRYAIYDSDKETLLFRALAAKTLVL